MSNTSDSNAAPAPGSIFAGKYVIERTLGQGGMGIVLSARHQHLDEKVAIKLLLPEVASDKEVVQRFIREGQSAFKIRSEHVVRMLDVAMLESGTPYIVMEYLDGKNLDELVEAGGPLPVHVAIDFVAQALEALAEAHALGMVHRDLKPANLFVTHRADGSPCIKVLDFGISKVTNASPTPDMALTKTSAVMGSPHFMSPEQMRSTRNVDARADVWAIGVILHQVLSGKPPFNGESLPELFAQILQDPAPPLSRIRGDIPAGLERIVLHCLEKDPERRFQNVADLAAALAEFGTLSARTSADRVMRVLQVKGGAFSQAEPVQSPQARSQYLSPTGPQGQYAPPPTGSNFAPAPVPQTANAGPMMTPPAGMPQYVATQYPQNAPYAHVPPAQLPSTTAPSTNELPYAPVGYDSRGSNPIAPAARGSNSMRVLGFGVGAGLVVLLVGIGAWKAGSSGHADAIDGGVNLVSAAGTAPGSTTQGAATATEQPLAPLNPPPAQLAPIVTPQPQAQAPLTPAPQAPRPTSTALTAQPPSSAQAQPASPGRYVPPPAATAVNTPTASNTNGSKSPTSNSSADDNDKSAIHRGADKAIGAGKSFLHELTK